MLLNPKYEMKLKDDILPDHEEIDKLHGVQEIYDSMLPKHPVFDTNQHLVGMYEGAMYLYPEYAGYYKDRIKALKV